MRARPIEATRDLTGKRPLILLTPDLRQAGKDRTEQEYCLRANYAEAIGEAGGFTLIVPLDLERIGDALAMASGVVITGTGPGAEVAAERLAFEELLIREALRLGKPLLGICHGMQMIGEHLGGHVIRDDPELVAGIAPHIPREVPDTLAHDIVIEPESALFELAGGTSARVNSLHRHVLAGDGRFRVVARAFDGVVEAIEGTGDGFCMGVQWHPEYCLSDLDRILLRRFVQHCVDRAGSAGAFGSGFAERLSALGLGMPEASVPPGAFAGAVRAGRLITVSGQVPLKEGRVLRTGRLGEDLSIEEGQECARWAVLNALAQLGQAAGGLERIESFVRLAGYVAATADFTRHGAVVDGASELLRNLFPDNWTHARVVLGVASLPRGVPVEIELSAMLTEEVC